jgi:hypothetical protein
MRIAVIFNIARADTWGLYFLRAFRQLGHEVTHCAFDDAAMLKSAFHHLPRPRRAEPRGPQGARSAAYQP